jgi:hypothetical protein
MANDEIEFDEPSLYDNDKSNALTSDDFGTGNYLKNPKVGETLVLDIVRVEKSDKTTAKNKTTGKEFPVGLKKKDGSVNRFDIHCTDGVYTISNWEIFFKLLGNADSILMKYARAHNKSFAGAKVSITRLVDGGYGSTKVEDLAKILGKTVAEAQQYQNEIKQAIKEQRLFEVKEA